MFKYIFQGLKSRKQEDDDKPLSARSDTSGRRSEGRINKREDRRQSNERRNRDERKDDKNQRRTDDQSKLCSFHKHISCLLYGDTLSY